MGFANGDLFRIEMRNGIYQVLGLYSADEEGNVYYFRKVFDGKLNLKVSKAEFVHEGWMREIGGPTRERLSSVMALPETQAVLRDLTIERLMQFGTNLRQEILFCSMDPKNRRKTEKSLNSRISGNLDPFWLRNEIRRLHDEGVLRIEYDLAPPAEGKRLYRIELGRYCDDFDEFGSKMFREMRFHELKIESGGSR